MRVLVDTEALNHPTSPESAFWKAVLPELTSRPEHQFFLLNRANNSFQAGNGAIVLNAPFVDFDNAILEDRRLSALCAELQIDAFISTFYTSAGATVNSIFIGIDGSNLQKRTSVRIAATRAAKLASGRLAFSETAASGIEALTGVRSCATVLSTPNILDRVEAIMRALHAAPDAKTESVRTSEETLLCSESERLRMISERKAEKVWKAARTGGPLAFRLVRAMLKVQRYPEFIRRIRHSLGSAL